MAYDPSDGTIRGRILTNINLLSVGNTLLFTIPDGFYFIPVINGRLIITVATGTGIGVFAVSAGSNSPGYDNIYSSISPALGAIGVKKAISLSPALNVLEQIDGAIYLRVSNAASGFTTLTGTFYMPYILVKKS